MMDRDLVKAVVGIVASAGVGVVIKNAVKHTSPVETSKTDKFLIGVGSFVLTGMVTNQAIKYTDEQTDYFFETLDKIRMNRSGSAETVVIPEDSTDVS